MKKSEHNDLKKFIKKGTVQNFVLIEKDGYDLL